VASPPHRKLFSPNAEMVRTWPPPPLSLRPSPPSPPRVTLMPLPCILLALPNTLVPPPPWPCSTFAERELRAFNVMGHRSHILSTLTPLILFASDSRRKPPNRRPPRRPRPRPVARPRRRSVQRPSRSLVPRSPPCTQAFDGELVAKIK